jgi:hypothetical protein
MQNAECSPNGKSLADRHGLLACLILAVVLRGVVLYLHAEELTRDRDAYLGIARSVAEGNGYSTPNLQTPTAFRPPLYPLQLAGFMVILPDAAAVVVLSLIWGVIGVWATWHAGRWLGLGGHGSLLAAMLVAIDPVLLQYSAQPMTEVACAGLVALLVFWMVRRDGSEALRRLVIGVVFGALVLCRPTFWPMAFVVFTGWGLIQAAAWLRGDRDHRRLEFAAAFPWRVIAATLLVVAPWVIRNQLVMGSPIVMTTHGGYTLLLANNPVFYSEVVDRGWGSEWTEASFEKWQQELHAAMAEQLGPNASEVDRDRWQSLRARAFIESEPVGFLRAAWYRFQSLWSTQPQGASAAAGNRLLVWLVSWYYVAVQLAFALGIILAAVAIVKGAGHPFQRAWWPLIAMVVTVQLVHLVYWTNARMRAPLVPAISLMAVGALQRATDFVRASRPASSAR